MEWADDDEIDGGTAADHVEASSRRVCFASDDDDDDTPCMKWAEP